MFPLNVLLVVPIFLLNFLIIPASLANLDSKNIRYSDSDTDGFNIHLNEGKIKLGTDIECGLVSDDALYTSFGLETQVFKCTKIVFSTDAMFESYDPNHHFLFKFDFAPLYDSLKTTRKKKAITFITDSAGHNLDGNNPYFDWYKNLGTRVYNLGSVPIIETYVGYTTPNHTIKFGRMKSIVGFDDNEVFWEDDAKFAPMGYWLSKDLFSGGSYEFNYSKIKLMGAIYSGANPAKGYTNYLGGIETPNLKSNNTPSYAGTIKLYYDDLLSDQISGHIFASYLSNVTGSTWRDELNDGKRNSAIGACGGVVEYKFNNSTINSIKVFGQYTSFLSGLRKKSAKNSTSKRYKDISQKGFFTGIEFKTLGEKLSIGTAYERFDRFDYNLYKIGEFSEQNKFKNSTQNSIIFSIKYKISPMISIGSAFHKIKNPVPFASNILDKHGMNKFKVTLSMKL